jgi:hypothetical protein
MDSALGESYLEGCEFPLSFTLGGSPGSPVSFTPTVSAPTTDRLLSCSLQTRVTIAGRLPDPNFSRLGSGYATVRLIRQHVARDCWCARRRLHRQIARPVPFGPTGRIHHVNTRSGSAAGAVSTDNTPAFSCLKPLSFARKCADAHSLSSARELCSGVASLSLLNSTQRGAWCSEI